MSFFPNDFKFKFLAACGLIYDNWVPLLNNVLKSEQILSSTKLTFACAVWRKIESFFETLIKLEVVLWSCSGYKGLPESLFWKVQAATWWRPLHLKHFIVFLHCLALCPFFVQIKQRLPLNIISLRISGFVIYHKILLYDFGGKRYTCS